MSFIFVVPGLNIVACSLHAQRGSESEGERQVYDGSREEKEQEETNWHNSLQTKTKTKKTQL